MTLRRLPSDFLVEEIPAEGLPARWAASQPGRGHAVYELTKASLTTPEACLRLAKAVGVKGGSVEYAGLKDKHARTSQYVSVAWSSRTAEAAADVAGPGWSARLAGWSAEAVNAGIIRANRFTIVVRGLTRATCDELDRRARLLDRGGGVLAVINYFGDQRFASARAGRGFIARRLIEGDFEGALRLAIGTPARKDAARLKQARKLIAARWGDWRGVLEQLGAGPGRRAVEVLAAGGDFRDAFAALPHLDQVMAIEAYQSFLWNATARRMAETVAGATALRAEDEFGEMVFPQARAMPPDWASLCVPLLASTSRIQGVWGEAAQRTLKAEGIELDQLRILGLRRPAFGEALRPLVCHADNVELGEPGPDELSTSRRGRRTVRFDLPRGAYATVVLRALGQ